MLGETFEWLDLKIFQRKIILLEEMEELEMFNASYSVLPYPAEFIAVLESVLQSTKHNSEIKSKPKGNFTILQKLL